MHAFFSTWLHENKASPSFSTEGVFILSSPWHVSLSYYLLETCKRVHVCVCVYTRLAKHETARGEDWRECLLCFLKQTLKADEWYQEVRLTRTRLDEKLWGRAFFLPSLSLSLPVSSDEGFDDAYSGEIIKIVWNEVKWDAVRKVVLPALSNQDSPFLCQKWCPRSWQYFEIFNPSLFSPLRVRINYLSILYTLICHSFLGGLEWYLYNDESIYVLTFQIFTLHEVNSIYFCFTR